MNKILPTIILGLSITLAHSEPMEEMGEFLSTAMSNTAKAQGSSFNFPAYIKNIQVVSAKAGKVAIVELGNDSLHGHVMTWGSAMLNCIIPVADAGKLEISKKYQIKGKILSISPYNRVDSYSNKMVSGNEIIAECSAKNEITIKPPSTTAVRNPGNFDIRGAKLGMSLSQASELFKVDVIPSEYGNYVHKSSDTEIYLTFTSGDVGSLLYEVSSSQRFNEALNLEAASTSAVEKYGKPDDVEQFAGSMGFARRDPYIKLYYGITRKNSQNKVDFTHLIVEITPHIIKSTLYDRILARKQSEYSAGKKKAKADEDQKAKVNNVKF